jgi:hypothetical protein
MPKTFPQKIGTSLSQSSDGRRGDEPEGKKGKKIPLTIQRKGEGEKLGLGRSGRRLELADGPLIDLRLHQLTAAKATGAYVNALIETIDIGANLLQIRQMAGLGFNVGVADLVSHYRLFVANRALSGHALSSEIKNSICVQPVRVTPRPKGPELSKDRAMVIVKK